MPPEESGASISLLSALATSDPEQKNNPQPPPAVGSASPRAQAPNSSPCSSTPSSPLLTCTPSLSPLRHAPSSCQVHETRAQFHKLEFRELEWPTKKRQLLPRTRAHEPCSVWVSTNWKGHWGTALGRAWRGLRVGLDGIRGPYWTLSRYFTPSRNPQRGITILLHSSINMRNPLPPSTPRSKLPGECLGRPSLCWAPVLGNPDLWVWLLSRLSPQLVAWALNIVMESESEF